MQVRHSAIRGGTAGVDNMPARHRVGQVPVAGSASPNHLPGTSDTGLFSCCSWLPMRSSASCTDHLWHSIDYASPMARPVCHLDKVGKVLSGHTVCLCDIHRTASRGSAPFRGRWYSPHPPRRAGPASSCNCQRYRTSQCANHTAIFRILKCGHSASTALARSHLFEIDCSDRYAPCAICAHRSTSRTGRRRGSGSSPRRLLAPGCSDCGTGRL